MQAYNRDRFSHNFVAFLHKAASLPKQEPFNTVPSPTANTKPPKTTNPVPSAPVNASPPKPTEIQQKPVGATTASKPSPPPQPVELAKIPEQKKQNM